MNPQVQGILSVSAAFLVLFTAMLEPSVSITLAVCALVALAIFQFANVSPQGKR